MWIAFKYSIQWRFQYSAVKSVAQIFGVDEATNTPIVLGGKHLKVSDTHTHVGVPLCTSKKAYNRAIEGRMSSCRQAFFTIKSVSPPPTMMQPTIMTKLYWSLCVTKMTYGMEIWPIDKTCIEMVESVHRDIGKNIQGLPVQTSKPASYVTLGWSSVECHVDLAKLLFLWKLVSLPCTSLYNRIVISRLTEFRFLPKNMRWHESPIYELYQTAIKYNLATVIDEMLDTGIVISRNRWVTMTKSATNDMYAAQWNMSAIMYPRLSGFLKLQNNECLSASGWWIACKGRPQLAKMCRTLVAILVGEHNLGSAKGRFVRHSKLCQICSMYVEETVHHFLLECDGLSAQRRTLMNNILTVMPPAMAESFQSLAYEQQTQFLLGELGRTLMPELFHVHSAVIRLVHELYSTRNSLLKDI